MGRRARGVARAAGVEVEVRSELPELRKILEEMPRRLDEDSRDPRPGSLTGAGVTLERLAALARAADSFLAAPGWRHLAPTTGSGSRPPTPRRRCGARPSPTPATAPSLSSPSLPTASGSGGSRGGRLRGPEVEPWGVWMAGFQPPWQAAAVDLELWEREGLPWVGKGLVPFVAYADRDGFRRPDARQLAFFEGCFAALAATTEADLDTGRWEKQVATADGEVRFVLSLPDLLEPPPELSPDPGPSFTSSSGRCGGEGCGGGSSSL